jgi:hypothetical protein
MTQDLYTEIVKHSQMMNTFDRDSFISDYAGLVLEDMDMDMLYSFAFHYLTAELEEHSDNQLVKDANDYYPELIQEYNIDPDIYI